MRAALDVALKDLRQKVRDRSALLISIVAPFALAALFSMVLGGLDEDFHAHWAFVDLDGGEIAAALDDGPISAMEAEGVIEVVRLDTEAAARAAIEAGEVETAIIVPEGFTASSAAGTGGNVTLIVDPDAIISGQVARSVLDGFASQVDAVQLSVATALIAGERFPDAGTTVALAEQAVAMVDPIRIVDAAAADRQAGWTTYYAAAMAILFVFLAAQFGIVSIHAERRSGTLARMLAAPLHWWSIIVGKILVSMVLALVSMTVIIVGTGLLLGAAWGDPAAVVPLVLSAALAATGISLLTVAFTKNEEQAGSAIAIVSLSLAVIGGSFFPANQGPELLSQLSLIAPHAWFLDGINDISTGGDLASSAGPILVLATIGLVTGGLGMVRAKRMVDRLMAALEIARVNLLRALRERTNLFFVFLLPLIIIIALGAAFGGAGTSRLGVVSAGAGALGEELVSIIEAGDVDVDVRERGTLEELQSGVEDGDLEFGLLIPPGYDEALRGGEDVELTLVARPESIFAALGQGISTAVAEQSAQVRAARIAADFAEVDFATALEGARGAQDALEGITIEEVTLGEATFPSIGNPFALGAQNQTVLFMFLTSMTAATQLLLTRQLGVSRRMLATPTPVRSILVGELLGRFAIAMMQGLFIVLASTLLFGVRWGDLVGSSTVIVVFALVGTGAAMVVGVFARNADQAGSIGVVFGMILGALGGAMVPGELFDEPMATISMLTPHYWAIDAFRELVFYEAGVTDIVTQLAVLAAYALALVAIGTWGLRRSLTRG